MARSHNAESPSSEQPNDVCRSQPYALIVPNDQSICNVPIQLIVTLNSQHLVKMCQGHLSKFPNIDSILQMVHFSPIFSVPILFPYEVDLWSNSEKHSTWKISVIFLFQNANHPQLRKPTASYSGLLWWNLTTWWLKRANGQCQRVPQKHGRQGSY